MRNVPCGARDPGTPAYVPGATVGLTGRHLAQLKERAMRAKDPGTVRHAGTEGASPSSSTPESSTSVARKTTSKAAVDCFQELIRGIVAEDFVKLRTELFEFLCVQRGSHRMRVDDREDGDHRDGDVYPDSDSPTTDKGMEYDSRRDDDGTNHMAMEASILDSVQTAPTQPLPTPSSQLEPHLPMQTDPTPSLPTPPATTAAAQLQPHPPMQTALTPALPTPSSNTQTDTTEAAQLQPFLRLWNAAGSGDCGIIGVLETNFVKPAAADDANQDEISHDQESLEYNEPQQDLLPHGRIPKRIRTLLSMIQEQAALIDILVEERKQRDEVEAGLRETLREAYNTISELVEKVKQLEGRGRLPPSFRIILRGKEVEHHNIVNDLMLTKELTYLSNMVTTMTIGFVKDARHHIDIQGFNIYHKNKHIQLTTSKRFESSAALDRLKNCLIKIQKEYWANNCQEIGYAPRASQHSKKTSSSKRKSGSPSAADDADQDEVSHDQESFEYNEAQQNLLPHGRISKRIRTSLVTSRSS
ncbi:hypothetical protein QYF36_011149 [Acer negundo]|nr:hypothetical protein QYF36_011149 [Acer negundo]